MTLSSIPEILITFALLFGVFYTCYLVAYIIGRAFTGTLGCLTDIASIVAIVIVGAGTYFSLGWLGVAASYIVYGFVSWIVLMFVGYWIGNIKTEKTRRTWGATVAAVLGAACMVAAYWIRSASGA